MIPILFSLNFLFEDTGLTVQKYKIPSSGDSRGILTMRLITIAALYLFGLSNALSVAKGGPSQAVFALPIERVFGADEIYRVEAPSNGTSWRRKRTFSTGIANEVR